MFTIHLSFVCACCLVISVLAYSSPTLMLVNPLIWAFNHLGLCWHIIDGCIVFLYGVFLICVFLIGESFYFSNNRLVYVILTVQDIL